ncbi:hypothetical protein DAPPUDRAFT_325731 [Daphnia pulex]|uniref:Uncharacterized protein n=1 Tax=Daphnia pulex TaxID=6669 RepID=E9H5E0_DAPPU|nr:hypothetical protein DAPPUDRAFT_325731 [Daphnia pulex]|eukprot:EFX72943.1 hypothetical protein DAPPUDRAFT_325731 [Daphnia pulex]
MKVALIFLSIFVAISHQQYFHPRLVFGFPWMSPFAQEPMAVHDYNEEIYPDLMELSSSRNGNDQDEGFNDIQSRVKGFSNNFNGLSRYRPNPSSNGQQNARFFFNWANTGNNANNNNNFNNYNPFFKTATFTLTSTLTLASIQTCVPSLQVTAMAPACRRKRSEIADVTAEQYPINPSETLRLMPTALSSPQDRSVNTLLSSRDDVSDELSTADHLREKRFFYANKNLFVVSSTITSYAFVNTTVTVTVNLINPPPAVQCSAVAAAAVPQCVACLPAGFIVCPAPAAG